MQNSRMDAHCYFTDVLRALARLNAPHMKGLPPFSGRRRLTTPAEAASALESMQPHQRHTLKPVLLAALAEVGES